MLSVCERVWGLKVVALQWPVARTVLTLKWATREVGSHCDVMLSACFYTLMLLSVCSGVLVCAGIPTEPLYAVLVLFVRTSMPSTPMKGTFSRPR